MEHSIGAHYGTFIVHSHHDFLVLKKACRAAKLRVPALVISSHDIPLHNPEANLPPNKVDTLYNVIGCSNEQFKASILNFLVDEVRFYSPDSNSEPGIGSKLMFPTHQRGTGPHSRVSMNKCPHQ